MRDFMGTLYFTLYTNKQLLQKNKSDKKKTTKQAKIPSAARPILSFLIFSETGSSHKICIFFWKILHNQLFQYQNSPSAEEGALLVHSRFIIYMRETTGNGQK